MSFKKLILVGAVVGVGIFAFRSTKIGMHAKQEVSNLVDWVESNIPAEKEIARLRKDITALDKDIKSCGSAFAKEKVEVSYLKEETTKMRDFVTAEHSKIVATGDAISAALENPISTGKGSNATVMIKYNNRPVSASEAKLMLDADVTRHLSRKKALAAMETSLAAREKVRDSLYSQLDELKRKKIELSAEIDTIEAEFNVLKLQQMESKYSFDNSRLSRIKDSLQDLKKKHAIAAEELKIAPLVSEDGVRTSVESMSVTDILDRMNGEKAETSKGDKVSKN